MPRMCVNGATTTDDEQDVFRLRFPLCKRVVRHTTYYGITCFTVCALVFGGTALGGAGDDGGLRFGRLGRSRINTRTEILVATTTAAFVFWYHGSASTQGDHSDVSRPIAEEHGELCSPDAAVHDAGRIDNTEVLQRARLWNHETAGNADPWEAAVRNFPFVSVSLASLWKLTRDVPNRRCLTILFSESPEVLLFIWELAVRTDVNQHRCRVISRSLWWDLSCADDVWLHEQATMNRAHNLFVDEQLARIQTNRDESCCYFADHKTMQVRPASTYDFARNTRICLMELRDARAYEFERTGSCADDVWLHEQATMNRAHNLFVDEQLARIQTNRDESGCYFADHKTMQVRPASTYDLARNTRICLMELRDAPAYEFEPIYQHVKTMQPYMMVAQQNEDSFSDEEIRTLYNQQVNQGGYFLLNMGGCPREQDSNWDTSLGFWTKLPGLIRSFAEPGEDLHLHYESARRVAEAAVESDIARFQRTGSARQWNGTFLNAWPTHLAGALEKADRKKAERINQELQEKLCQTFQSEAAIDFTCDQDRVLREHFPLVARSHREEIPPELEEIYEPRRLGPEEKEDDETETARELSERGRRELFRQDCNLGHPQPTELHRALQHAGARREAIRCVLKELNCPTCAARPLPLPLRPGMLPRCLRFNQCIGVDLVDLEVRDGTSAKALNVVC